MDRLTNQLQLALSDAQSLAIGRDQQFIEPGHLLSAMLDQKNASVRPLLTQAGANVARLKEAINDYLDNLPTVQGGSGDIVMSNDLARLMNLSDKISQQNKDSYISCEVVLLAIFEANNSVTSFLRDAGVDKQSLQAAIENIRGGESIDDPAAEESRQALEKYTLPSTGENLLERWTGQTEFEDQHYMVMFESVAVSDSSSRSSQRSVQEADVFKIGKENIEEWQLKMPDTKNFDPSGKGRAMKDWLQVPAKNKKYYDELLDLSLEFTFG